MGLAPPVTAGDAVLDVTGDLADGEAGLEDVDRHPDLDTPAPGQWRGRVEGGPADAALTGERLDGAVAGDGDNPPLREAHDPAAATPGGVLRGQVGDGEVRPAEDDRDDERGEVGGARLEVGVDEEQGPADGEALGDVLLSDPAGS